ncbi:MAG: helix-turn-helix domain-containing protein [Sulfuricella denitrificans]|nr:helix-turn-helix domain-containing protein [Sulfuricella denitrificans]
MKNTKPNHSGNSAAAQRQRLLVRLLTGPLTTIEARRDLDILMPAARVHELRHREGLDIQTIRVSQETDSGIKHNVALYVLQP